MLISAYIVVDNRVSLYVVQGLLQRGILIRAILAILIAIAPLEICTSVLISAYIIVDNCVCNYLYVVHIKKDYHKGDFNSSDTSDIDSDSAVRIWTSVLISAYCLYSSR